jgi:NADH-quinone oxidoreductase subunit G
MTVLRDLMTAIGSPHLDCRQDGAAFDASRRDFYLFNTTIAGIEDSDALLLVGCNPRHLSPVINARIRKRALAGAYPVAAIGDPGADPTYPVTLLGDSPSLLESEIEAFAGAKRPMIIVGEAAFARPDGAAVLAACWRLAERIGALSPDWHGFNVLHSAAARVGGLDLGLLPGPGGHDAAAMAAGGVEVLWLLGADEFDAAAIPAGTFVIYQGSHGDRGAARADVILPGATWTEKEGTYVNTEGRAQIAFRASFPPGEAREDWRILRAMADRLGVMLAYDDLPALRDRMVAINPVFAREHLPRFGVSDRTGPAGGEISTAPITADRRDYYLTNPISRASVTMHACSEVIASPLAEAAE